MNDLEAGKRFLFGFFIGAVISLILAVAGSLLWSAIDAWRSGLAFAWSVQQMFTEFGCLILLFSMSIGINYMQYPRFPYD